MKFQEISQKTEGELQKMLHQKREKLRQLRFDLKAGKVKNVREIREVKKDIARILTALSQKRKQKEQKNSK